jgi:replication-associated recombination protein RarA
MVPESEYQAFKKYMKQKATVKEVTVPPEEIKAFNDWKEKINKEGKIYDYSYAHDTACTPYHMSPSFLITTYHLGNRY